MSGLSVTEYRVGDSYLPGLYAYRRSPDNAAESRNLVIYEEGDLLYLSVVATGTLEEIHRGNLTVEQIEQYGRAKRPLFEIWGEPSQDLKINLYQFAPDDLRGRPTEVDRTNDSC